MTELATEIFNVKKGNKSLLVYKIMSDNLTKQFKAQLANRGITASDSDINNFISQQPDLFPICWTTS